MNQDILDQNNLADEETENIPNVNKEDNEQRVVVVRTRLLLQIKKEIKYFIINAQS